MWQLSINKEAHLNGVIMVHIQNVMFNGGGGHN